MATDARSYRLIVVPEGEHARGENRGRVTLAFGKQTQGAVFVNVMRVS